MDCCVNVQPWTWLRVFPNAKNPLTSALSDVFAIPSDDPADLKLLLKRIEQLPRR